MSNRQRCSQTMKSLQENYFENVASYRQKTIHCSSSKRIWLCMAVLILCVLVQSLKKKWAPGNPSRHFPMIPEQGQSGDTGPRRLMAAQAGGLCIILQSHHQFSTALLAWSPPSLPVLPYQSNVGNTVGMWSGLNSEYFILFMESVTIFSCATQEAQGFREITRR